MRSLETNGPRAVVRMINASVLEMSSARCRSAARAERRTRRCSAPCQPSNINQMASSVP